MASNSPSFAHWFIAGGAAGITADVLFFPVDTVKTRLQSAQGFLHAGGFRGVYQGLGSVLAGSAPSAAAFFATYDTLKLHLPLPPHLDAVNHIISSSVAEAVGASQTSTYGTGDTSSLSAARQTFAAEGIRGFYRGFGITLCCEIPFTAIQFPLYEALKSHVARRLNRKTLYGHEAGICGFVASALAAVVTTPLDVLKTRVMLDILSVSGAARPTFRKHLIEIYNKKDRLHVFFSGAVPRTIWVSAGGAVFLGVYEWVMHGLMGY